MREIFSKAVNDDRISLSEGYFDTTGVEDGWADLVVIAQVLYFFITGDRLNFEYSNRLSIGAQIMMQPLRSFLVYSSRRGPLLGSGI